MPRLTDEGALPDIQHLGTNIIHTVDVTDNADDPAGSSFQTTWQKAKDLFFGLQFWTESRETAAPNDFVNVSKWTPIALTATADAVIEPKGTGAFQSQVADNTTAGGNKRGTYAIDFQRQRNNTNQVASGLGAVILGGANNRAGGQYDLVMGSDHSLTSGQHNFTHGFGNIGVNVSYTFMSGALLLKTGSYGILSGQECIGAFHGLVVGLKAEATEQFGNAIGEELKTEGKHATVLGKRSNGNELSGRITHAAGGYSDKSGDSQGSFFTLSNRTVSTQTQILVADPNALSTQTVKNTWTFNNVDDSCTTFVGEIVAKNGDNENFAVWEFKLIVVRGTTNLSTLMKFNNVQEILNDQILPTPIFSIDDNAGSSYLKVLVEGIVDEPWHFTLHARATEARYNF